MSAADIDAVNAARRKAYPDLSATSGAIPTKETLEGHHSLTFRAFDMWTPDALTVAAYRAAKGAEAGRRPAREAGDHPDRAVPRATRASPTGSTSSGPRQRSRCGPLPRLPALSIMQLPCDHTSASPRSADAAVHGGRQRLRGRPAHRGGLDESLLEGHGRVHPRGRCAGRPRPRGCASVAGARGRARATGPARSSTSSTTPCRSIRTIELLLGMRADEPARRRGGADRRLSRRCPTSTPYRAVLPEVAPDNLMNADARASSAAYGYFLAQSDRQDLTHPDMADPRVLNQVIWFSVRGPASPMPAVARLPVFDAMQAGMNERAGRSPARSARIVAARQ